MRHQLFLNELTLQISAAQIPELHFITTEGREKLVCFAFIICLFVAERSCLINVTEIQRYKRKSIINIRARLAEIEKLQKEGPYRGIRVRQ